MPALNPDVTIVHAQHADRRGNVMMWGITGVQKEAVLAAERALVTVEEIVDELTPRPGAVVLPSWAVSHVAAVPGGAHPSYAQGYSRATTTSTGRGTPSGATATVSSEWLDEHVMRSPDVTESSDRPGRRRWSSPRLAACATADVCFVGIGLPSTAANLARRTHAPNLVLVYESGTLGSKPQSLPLSIGDGELADTADSVVSVPEVFNYWLQPGRIDVGFLGGAQIDRFANINSTVIGDYANPKVRLPGAGGAPEIAASCREVFVLLRQTPGRSSSASTSCPRSASATARVDRERLGLRGAGPQVVVTDLGILRPIPRRVS